TRLGDEEGKISSYVHLAAFYKPRNKELASTYAIQALKTARGMNDLDSELKALALLISVSSASRARDFAQEYVGLKDSLEKASLKSKNLFAKIKYDEERKLERISD